MMNLGVSFKIENGSQRTAFTEGESNWLKLIEATNELSGLIVKLEDGMVHYTTYEDGKAPAARLFNSNDEFHDYIWNL